VQATVVPPVLAVAAVQPVDNRGIYEDPPRPFAEQQEQQRVFSSDDRINTQPFNEEFNPAMWIALRNAQGYGNEVDVSTPTAAARFLLSRLQSSAVNRRNQMAQQQPAVGSRYAHAPPHYPQGMQQPQYGMPMQQHGFPQLAGFGFAQ
jgi:hypothetical protein